MKNDLKNFYREIGDKYLSGLSSGNLAKFYGVTDTTIFGILTKLGIERRKRKIPISEHQKIISIYQSGKSSAYLAKIYNVTDVSILKILKQNDVKSRDPSLSRMIYPIWHEAFSELTPQAAYWIGFLMADGCVLDESKVVLCLKIDDKHHIEKYRTFLRTESRPIYYIKSTNSCALKIHSRQIVKDLCYYGVVPQKSLIAKSKNNIHLHPAFWLGVIDGDGCIISSKRITVKLCGSKDLMSQFIEFLEHHKIRGRSNTFKVSMHKHNGIWHVTLLGQRAINLLNLLYSHSPVSLDRKHKIAIPFLSF